MLLAEHLRQPLCLTGVCILVTERTEIIGHIKELLHLDFHRFDVAHVQQPVAVGTGGIGLQQFLIHQHRGCGSNPKVVVGCT